jgi:hypothetical protein
MCKNNNLSGWFYQLIQPCMLTKMVLKLWMRLKNFYKLLKNKKMYIIGPNKIKVLVLRQRRPLKISTDGMFLLSYRKKIAAAPYFWRNFFFKFTAKFKFSSVPVARTSFDKCLNDWSIENESKNSAWLRVKTLSSSVLMYSYVPNK